MKRLRVDELTRLAFVWAEQDRAALAEAWPEGSPEHAEAQSEHDQLRAYRMKRWGRTRLEQILGETEPRPILKRDFHNPKTKENQ